MLPGATVMLKDEGTGITKETVTNESGAFAFRDLNFGTYQVTVNAAGLPARGLQQGRRRIGPHDRPARQARASAASKQTITVEGTTPVLEMTSNVISSTLNNKTITELPLAGRNAFTFARLVPGAVAPQGTGSTHFNGMPGGTINPTIDGVNNSSNGFKSGGTSFFGTVPARLGAVEEVTVETAGLGGDAGVTGGVNLKFVTRRGTNEYRGSVFEQYRTEKLNANSFDNNARGLPKAEAAPPRLRRQLRRPVIQWRCEQAVLLRELRAGIHPADGEPRRRRCCSAEAQQGIFRYQTAAGEQRTVNVLDIAAANGFRSTPDPIIAQHPGRAERARGSTARSTSTNNLRTEALDWLEPQKQINYYPTVRVDYQIKTNLSLMTSYNRYNQDAQGRRVWPIPGLPDQLRHVRLRLVGVVDRPELDDQLQHAQRAALRHPAQRRHQRARPRARDTSC